MVDDNDSFLHTYDEAEVEPTVRVLGETKLMHLGLTNLYSDYSLSTQASA